jgi:hypothetical protein
VPYTYNRGYSEGRNQEDRGLARTPGKKFTRLHLNGKKVEHLPSQLQGEA